MNYFRNKFKTKNPEVKSKFERIIVIGKNGFIGSSVINALNLKSIPTINIGRDEIDLTSKGAINYFSTKILQSDIVVFAAGDVPVKTVEQFNANLTGLDNFIKGIDGKNLTQLIYVSSDAVYMDSNKPLTEDSFRGPANLHGLMHLTREIILQNSAHKNQLCIVRPTLIYGINDPHNGYGPCSFVRLAKYGKEIVLFGDGEEERDFIHITDVGEIISKVILEQFIGDLNIATGKVHSFFEIASVISQVFGNKSKIVLTPRKGLMPHNGYRPFEINKLKTLFPTHSSKSLHEGINLMVDN